MIEESAAAESATSSHANLHRSTPDTAFFPPVVLGSKNFPTTSAASAAPCHDEIEEQRKQALKEEGERELAAIQRLHEQKEKVTAATEAFNQQYEQEQASLNKDGSDGAMLLQVNRSEDPEPNLT